MESFGSRLFASPEVTMRKVSGEQVLKLLEQVTAEKGTDYRYPEELFLKSNVCVNFTSDGQPSCIVGHVLPKLGVDYEIAVAYEIDGGSSAASTVRTLEEYGHTGFTHEALAALATAQNFQDFGWTWGEAVEAARASVDTGVIMTADRHPDWPDPYAAEDDMSY
jgi:hypothetical protein